MADTQDMAGWVFAVALHTDMPLIMLHWVGFPPAVDLDPPSAAPLVALVASAAPLAAPLVAPSYSAVSSVSQSQYVETSCHQHLMLHWLLLHWLVLRRLSE